MPTAFHPFTAQTAMVQQAVPDPTAPDPTGSEHDSCRPTASRHATAQPAGEGTSRRPAAEAVAE